MLLYALRYENHPGNEVENLIDLLHQSGNTLEEIGVRALCLGTPHLTSSQAIGTVLRFCGQHARVGTLFTSKSFLELARSSLQRGLQGVSNVFTQHKPLLHSLIEQALKGKLSETDYPFLGSLPPKELYAARTSLLACC